MGVLARLVIEQALTGNGVETGTGADVAAVSAGGGPLP